jgi:hypothetical protein
VTQPEPIIRDRHLTLIAGTLGMGKTWLARELIRRWALKNAKANCYVISSKPEWAGAWWPPATTNKDGDLISADEDPETFYPWVRAMTNFGRGPTGPTPPMVGRSGAMALLDDMDTFVPKVIKSQHGSTPWYGFFTKYREFETDIIGTVHRLERVSNDIVGAAHYAYLFAQKERRSFDNICQMPELEDLDLMHVDPPQSRGECVRLIIDPEFKGPREERVRRFNFLKAA